MSRVDFDLSEQDANRESNAKGFRPGTQAPRPALDLVPVQLAALSALRARHATLEAYIRASFASHERFGQAIAVDNTIFEGRKQLRNKAHWKRLDDSLSAIDSLSGSLRALGAEDETLAASAAAFDSALHKARSLVRSMRNVAQEGDPKVAAADLEEAVYEMRQASRDMVHRCEIESERVIDGMRLDLTSIFARIEVDRERSEAEQQPTPPLPNSGAYRPDDPGASRHDEASPDLSDLRSHAAEDLSNDSWASSGTATRHHPRR